MDDGDDEDEVLLLPWERIGGLGQLEAMRDWGWRDEDEIDDGQRGREADIDASSEASPSGHSSIYLSIQARWPFLEIGFRAHFSVFL